VLKLLYPIIFNLNKKSFHNHYMTSYLVGFSFINYNSHLSRAKLLHNTSKLKVDCSSRFYLCRLIIIKPIPGRYTCNSYVFICL
jgi:hypothetical protein